MENQTIFRGVRYDTGMEQLHGQILHLVTLLRDRKLSKELF